MGVVGGIEFDGIVGEGWYVGVSQAGYIGVSHMMRLRAKCQ
jgi:hypothetical protein